MSRRVVLTQRRAVLTYSSPRRWDLVLLSSFFLRRRAARILVCAARSRSLIPAGAPARSVSPVLAVLVRARRLQDRDRVAVSCLMIQMRPQGGLYTHRGDSYYNYALSAATANLGSTHSLCMNDALPWVLAICFSALHAHSCANVRFAILPRAAILSIMPKTY